MICSLNSFLAALLQQQSCNANHESERSLLRTYARQRHPGTCDWLFSHTNYCAWLSSNGPAGLWISGKVGAGKTILSSSILEDLEKNKTRDTVVIGCFCEEVYGQSYSAQDLLGYISCKLRKYRPQLAPEPILSCTRDDSYRRRSSVSSADFKRHLKCLLAGVDPRLQIILLFDGLDNNELLKGLVVDEIIEANLKRDRLRQFKFCISSRTPFNAALHSDQITHVSMNEEPGLHQDIYRYTEVKVAALPYLSAEGTLSQARLTEQVCSYANGMFLWVALVMHKSHDLESLSATLQAVHSLPSHIEGIYQQLLQSIPSSTSEIARRAFHWLIAACRPLKLFELAEAVAVDNRRLTGSWVWRSGKKPELPPPELDIARICGGLIVVTDDGFVRFIHSSARNYLLSQHGRNPPACSISGAHELIARTCLSYLRSERGVYSSWLQGRQLLTKPAELGHISAPSSYATIYWSLHYRIAELHNKSLAGSLQQLFSIELNNLYDYLKISSKSRSASIEQTALRISAAHGFTSLVKLYLEMGIHTDGVSCLYCETPLHLAAARGHTETVALLLNHGVSVESRESSYGETPLFLAAACGSAQTVGLLLDHGANPQAVSVGSAWTPLHVAAAHGHLDVMRLLLTCDIDINSVSIARNETPLHLAAHQGHLQIVECLLDSPQNSLSERELYQSIVMKPYYRTWSEEVLTDIGNKGRFIWEVDARSSAEEDLEKLRSFGKRYTDVNISTHDGRTALHYAASNGHEAVVRLLLESGANPDGGSHCSYTALRAAAENGHLAVVRLLLTHSSDMVTRMKDWGAVLERTADNGHRDVADLLLWQAFGLEVAGREFNSSMLCVATESKLNIVQGILQRKRADNGTETSCRKKKRATNASAGNENNQRRTNTRVPVHVRRI